MKKLLLLLLAAIIFSQLTTAQTINLGGGTTVVGTTIYTSPALPWELKYGPGDSLWMTTRSGQIWRIHAGNGNATLLLDHTIPVEENGEAGMLGMAFDPNFATNRYLYVVYNYLNAGNLRERLSRFTYSGNSLTSEFILIGGNSILGASIHNGSRLAFLPDGTLLMTTGDANNTALAQNLSSMNGKVLRINTDGSIPADNPYPGSYVYSSGHRNPQGLLYHSNGKIYETEHGEAENDEFQIIEPARNYGWPNVRGFCDNDINGNEITYCSMNNIREPLASWNPVPNGTWAPADITLYTHPAIPEFQNSLLVVFLKQSKMRKISLDASGNVVTGQQDFFAGTWGRLRDVEAAPNGDLFILTNSSPFRIIRVRNSTVVPVNLSDVTATCTGGSARISFVAGNEINISSYSILAGDQTSQLQSVATIAAQAGTGNQKQYAVTITGGFQYYKVVAEDISGRKVETNLISLNCTGGGSFALYPNPVRDNARLNITGITDPVTVRVFDAYGRNVYEQKTATSQNLPSRNWPAGMYIIIVRDERNKVMFREKLIKGK